MHQGTPQKSVMCLRPFTTSYLLRKSSTKRKANKYFDESLDKRREEIKQYQVQLTEENKKLRIGASLLKPLAFGVPPRYSLFVPN